MTFLVLQWKHYIDCKPQGCFAEGEAAQKLLINSTVLNIYTWVHQGSQREPWAASENVKKSMQSSDTAKFGA